MGVTTTTRWYVPAFLVGLAAALLVAGSATAEPASITGKRAEAQRVLAQIESLDRELGGAVEEFNRANVELDRIEAEQRANERLLKVARANLGHAQQSLAERVVAIYTADGGGSALEVVLGATSLEDLLNRIETVDRVSKQDERVLEQVVGFRAAVQTRKAELAQARTQAARLVEQRAAQRRAIEAKIAERERLVASIRSEITRLQAAERRRQLAAARAARARISASPQAYALSENPVQQTAASSSDDAEAAGAAPPARYGGVVGIAMQYLGVPYRWGGADPSGFDCSGFTMYVYGKVGVSLPHYTGSQWGMGVPVSRGDLQPGDLVFFNGLGHMGLYIGGGQFVHAPHTGDVVKVSSLNDSWYARTYMGARRIL